MAKLELKEKLQEAINKCEDVEKGLKLPFEINADEILELVKEGYKKAETIDELCLDARLLRKFVLLIYLQSNWLKHEADELYLDVGFVKERIIKLPMDTLYEVFLECWHPIVELEQLTYEALKMGVKHWGEISSFEPREILPLKVPTFISSQDATGSIIAEHNFLDQLEKFWIKLKKVSKKRKLQYWKFIKDKSFEKTVTKAYLTSFLLSYGYATLQERKGRIYLIPLSKKSEIKVPGESLAVAIGRET